MRWILLLFATLLLTVSALAQTHNGRVNDMWEMLNVRAAPDDNAPVVTELAGRTPLTVTGRSRDNRWYQVTTTDGLSGWAASGFITLTTIERAALPIILADAPAPPSAPEAAPEAAAPVAIAPATGATGRVTAGLLNLRSAPTTATENVIARLPLNTVISLVGRAGGDWLLVQTGDGAQGYVSSAYIASDVDLAGLPLVGADESAMAAAPVAAVAPVSGEAPYFTLGAAARNIFARGQTLGNRAGVFSKIGDSITVEGVMYRPIGFGQYDLGGYGYLQATIDYFMQTQARDNNSFNNTSLAATSGWTTVEILSADRANPQVCNTGETPLACEYRTTRPAVALIMLGSNDVARVPAEQYAYNMRAIIEISNANGVIPVLSTIPPRRGYENQVAFYNEIVVRLAQEYGLPLWDYHAAMLGLPEQGLSADGLHPSIPPEGFAVSARFTPEYLGYGYVTRNLTMLQALHVLRTQVLQ